METRTDVTQANGRTPQIGDFPFTGEVEAAVQTFQSWKDRLLDLAVSNPAEALFLVVTGGAWMFYQAEREVNPGCATYTDALQYISTCVSVGYSRVQPETQTGKLISAVVMSIGPSLSAWALEARQQARQAAEAPALAAALPAATAAPDFAPVVEKLDAILQELKAQRGEGSPAGEA
jgi:hypothetical protein